MTDAEVAPLDRSRLDEAAVVCARAFSTYPQWTALWPGDLRTRRRVLYGLYRSVVADALAHGVADAALDGRRVAGVSLWLPPDAYPLSLARQARSAPAALRAVLAFPGRARQAAQLAARIERHHPTAPPHWYLSTVAVDPVHQRRGVAGRLVRPGLAEIDARGEPSYLETADPANVAWYQRLGYEVTASEPAFDGGPDLHAMWREPAPPRVT